jgi:hypothetical protein
MGSMIDGRQQVVTGLVPPQLGEAVIRVAWPSVTVFSGVASLGRILMRSIIGAPLGWLLLAPIYFLKILPFVGRRYILTNQRVMIGRGIKAQPSQQVPLADIEDVRLQEGSSDPFYRTATLEIWSKGQVILRLPGMPEPHGFRHAVLNACMAWVPNKKLPGFEFIPAKSG